MILTNALIAKSAHNSATIARSLATRDAKRTSIATVRRVEPTSGEFSRGQREQNKFEKHGASSGFCNHGHERSKRHDFPARPRHHPSRRTCASREPIHNQPPSAKQRPSKSNTLQLERSPNHARAEIRALISRQSHHHAQG